MVLWWIGNVILLVVVLPVVIWLLNLVIDIAAYYWRRPSRRGETIVMSH